MKHYVISQSLSSDRYKSFSKKNSFVANFEFVEAVMGRSLPDSLVRSFFDHGFFSHFNKVHGFKALQGSVGCFLSHIKVYERIIEDYVSYGLVCEDDAVFKENIDQEVFEKLHNYDLVYLNKRMKVVSQSPRRGINGLRFDNIGGLGGEGYVISKKACELIVDFFNSNGYYNLPCGFDGFLQSLCVKKGEEVTFPGKRSLNKWRRILPFELTVGMLHPGIVLHDDNGVSLIRGD